MNHDANYRPDIDGLRALAVLPVVLYHAGIAPFTGGFVGVDVFFVISGYLITRIIAGEVDSGTFSIADFYERRARRLLPALFAVIAFCLVAGWWVLTPAEYGNLSSSVVAAILFASNFFFWNQLDYFAESAELYPLLHTWSLAVEEQFYLLFPLVLILTGAGRVGLRRAIVFAILVASLALSIYAVERNPQFAFFLLPTRAWELMAGAVLAIYALPQPRSDAVRGGLALLGLALIAVPMVTYSSETPFPGLASVPPCLGTVLLIQCGRSTLVGRILGSAPFVGVGLISYSLYLWHWPLMSLVRIETGSIELSLGTATAAVAIAVACAYLSWRFVERPFRRRTTVNRTQLVRYAGLGATTIAAAAASVIVANGFPNRFDPEVALALQEEVGEPENEARCAAGCPFGVEGERVSLILWGDSHAGASIPALDRVATERGTAGMAFAGPACAPLLGVRRVDVGNDWKQCAAMHGRVLEYLRSQKGEKPTVVLVARWALAATGKPAAGEGRKRAELGTIEASSLASNREVFTFGLDRTMSRLKKIGVDVVVVGGIPEIGWNVPKGLARAAMRDEDPPRSPSIKQYRKRQAPADKVIADLSKRFDFRFIDVAPTFCKRRCSVAVDGQPIYRDDDHLSQFGAEMVLGKLLSETM